MPTYPTYDGSTNAIGKARDVVRAANAAGLQVRATRTTRSDLMPVGASAYGLNDVRIDYSKMAKGANYYGTSVSTTGTARFNEPGNSSCLTLVLFDASSFDNGDKFGNVLFQLGAQTKLEVLDPTVYTGAPPALANLGTLLDRHGNRVPDPAWTLGTGLE